MVDLLKRLEQVMEQGAALEKKLKAYRDKESSQLADALAAKAAGKIVTDACGKLGGKGGGKPDAAMGGGTDVTKVAEALASVG